MDNLDFAILRHLGHPQSFQWNVRLSYADIARAVKADEETVRLRVHRLQEQGVIAGWEVSVHPQLLGRELVRLDLPPVAPEARERVMGALQAFDGARLLFEYYGGRLGLVVFQEPGPALDRQAALAAALTGTPPRVTRMPMPAPEVDLAPADWRILQALRRDPRAPYAAIAEALGVSERTLRRRIERMTGGRAVFLDPDVDFSRAAGVLPCMLRVLHHGNTPRQEVDAALRALPRIMFTSFEAEASRVSFCATSLNEVEDTRARIGALAGPEARVEIELMLRRTALSTWLDEQVARRAAPQA